MSEAERLATAPGERVASIDMLRGFAVLGILVMNVQAFSMPMAAYINPHAWGDLTGANYAVWFGSRMFFDGKFIAIFSMLFGAGIAMAATRDASSNAAVHYRRYTVLLAVGLLHAYFLWYGDVLTFYAVCAFVLYPFRHKSARALVAGAALFYALCTAIIASGGLWARSWSPELAERARRSVAPDPHELEAEIATMQGGFWEIFWDRLPSLIEWHLIGFPILFMPSLLALMLLGMALYKSGALHAVWAPKYYYRFIAAAMVPGVPLVYAGVLYLDAQGWPPAVVKYEGSLFNFAAAPIVALGWVGFLMLWCQSGRAPWLQHALACAGRMALTNYITQTLIGVFVFYGFGLGWFAQVERTGQLGFVVCVGALQLAWSPLWLKHFRYGPLEWLWRSLTYGRMQPMRQEA